MCRAQGPWPGCPHGSSVAVSGLIWARGDEELHSQVANSCPKGMAAAEHPSPMSRASPNTIFSSSYFCSLLKEDRACCIEELPQTKILQTNLACFGGRRFETNTRSEAGELPLWTT